MTETKPSIKVVIGVLVIWLIGQSSMILGPALSTIAAQYPDVAYSNVLLLSTIPQLCGIPVAIITGKIAGTKVSYKTLGMCSALFAIVGGIMPFFFRSFPMIILSRFIYGIAYNISIPIANALPLLFFDKDRAASMLGIGGTIQSLAGTAVQLLSGVVCAIDVNYVWLIHLYMAIPLVGIMFLLPEPKVEIVKPEVKIEEQPKQSYRMPWMTFIALGVSFCVFYPLVLNMSAIVTSEGIGTPATAGTILSLYSVGGMIGGVLFGQIYKILKRFTLPVALVCLIISLTLGYIGNNVPTLIAAAMLGGIGFFCVVPSIMISCRETMPPEAISPASGYVNAFLKVGAFSSAYFVGLVGSVSASSNPRLPLLVGLVIIVVVSIPWIISIAAKKPVEASN